MAEHNGHICVHQAALLPLAAYMYAGRPSETQQVQPVRQDARIAPALLRQCAGAEEQRRTAGHRRPTLTWAYG